MTLITFSVPVVHRVKLSPAGDKLTVGCKYIDHQFDIEEIDAFDAPTAVAWEQKYDFHIRHHRRTGRYFDRLINQPEDIAEVTTSEFWDGYSFNFDWWFNCLIEIVAETQGIDELPYNIKLPDMWEGLAPLRPKDVPAEVLAKQLEWTGEFMERFCLIDGAFYRRVSEPVAMVDERSVTPIPVTQPHTWIREGDRIPLMMFSLADWNLAEKFIKELGTLRGRLRQTVMVQELHRGEFNPIDPKVRKCCLLGAFIRLLMTHHGIDPFFELQDKIAGLLADDQAWVTKIFECIDDDLEDVADDRLDEMVEAVLSLDLSPGLREFGETSQAFAVIRQKFRSAVSKAA